MAGMPFSTSYAACYAACCTLSVTSGGAARQAGSFSQSTCGQPTGNTGTHGTHSRATQPSASAMSKASGCSITERYSGALAHSAQAVLTGGPPKTHLPCALVAGDHGLLSLDLRGLRVALQKWAHTTGGRLTLPQRCRFRSRMALGGHRVRHGMLRHVFVTWASRAFSSFSSLRYEPSLECGDRLTTESTQRVARVVPCRADDIVVSAGTHATNGMVYATCLLAIDAGLAMQMLKFGNRSFGKCVLAGVPRVAALRQAQRESKVRCNSLARREQHGDSGWSSERSYGRSPRRSPRRLASSSHPPAGRHVGGLTTTSTLGPSYAPIAATPGR